MISWRMSRLKLLQEPRAIAAFALTPLVAPLLALVFLAGRLSPSQWFYVIALAYAVTIVGGAPLFELLRRRTSNPFVVTGLAALLGAGAAVTPRLVTLLTHRWGPDVDLAPAILITIGYGVIALVLGAFMGLIFWLIAFARSTHDPAGLAPADAPPMT